MKNSIKLTLLCCIQQICFAQNATRKPLHGQVVNDSIKVENVVVFNVNSRIGTVVNAEGTFDLSARAKDTLVFSSLTFKTKKIILSDLQMEESPLIVKLDIYVGQLNEVIINNNNKKLNPIKGNTQKIVDKKYVDDEKSSPKNRLMPNDGSIENGVDFVRLYKDVMKSLKNKNKKKEDFVSQTNFTEVVLQKVKYTFYTNTLKLKDDQIRLFLIFCENDPYSVSIVKSKTNFEILDFLISKNKEFKQITASQK